jgi:LacI family transcriptional regulator
VDLLLGELGRCAAGFLLDAIAGNPHRGVTSLAPRLVIRASTIGD